MIRTLIILLVLLSSCGKEDRECGSWFVSENFYGSSFYQRFCTYNGKLYMETYNQRNGETSVIPLGDGNDVSTPVTPQ